MTAAGLIEMLDDYRPMIARAVAQQIQQTVSRYHDVDSTALTRNVEQIFAGLRRLLVRGDDKAVMNMFNMLIGLRQVSGFTIRDFMVATICALPVVRRFFCDKAETLDEGIALYEEFEAIVIPLYGRIACNFQKLNSEAQTTPDLLPVLPALDGLDGKELYAPLEFEIVEVGA